MSVVSGATTTNFVFDALDRLTTAGTVAYTYDSSDRVLTRKDGAAAATAFAYAGGEMDPVSDGSALYQRSPSGTPIGVTRGGQQALVGLQGHGDVAWTLNPATGAIADSVVLDPFGKKLATTGTAPTAGFQGDWTDPTSSLVWMAARWYNPATGTFMSRDTYPGDVSTSASMNRFTYGLNNPLRFADPTGHEGDELDPDIARDMGFSEKEIDRKSVV